MYINGHLSKWSVNVNECYICKCNFTSDETFVTDVKESFPIRHPNLKESMIISHIRTCSFQCKKSLDELIETDEVIYV